MIILTIPLRRRRNMMALKVRILSSTVLFIHNDVKALLESREYNIDAHSKC
jgi:hypothetical protein